MEHTDFLKDLTFLQEENGINIYRDYRDAFYFSNCTGIIVMNPNNLYEGFSQIKIKPTFILCRSPLGIFQRYLTKKGVWDKAQEYERDDKFIPIEPNTIYLYEDQLKDYARKSLLIRKIKSHEITGDQFNFSIFEKEFFARLIGKNYKSIFFYKKEKGVPIVIKI